MPIVQQISDPASLETLASLASLVTVSPSPESSVEISTNSKGEPQLTVKVYAKAAHDALVVAMSLYESGLIELEKIKQVVSVAKEKMYAKTE